MSKKDVLHIPPTAVPPAPDRSAGGEEHPSPHAPPMRPFEGPGGTPSESGNPRIITPQLPHDPYPGTHVS